jgi:thiosulfate/3-mercaptopyruvate sulfurtransferase
VPWDKVAVKRKVQGKELQGLVPEKAEFERLMQKSGVDKDSAVVITGKGEAVIDTALATRLYWTLKYFGFDNVALLDGGTAQWLKDGQEVEFGRSRAGKGNFAATSERSEILAGTDDVARLAAGGSDEQLLDARSTAEYLGLTAAGKFVAPGVKGHVSGAKNFPVDLYADSAGPAKIYSQEQIKQVSALLGIDQTKPTVAMCNSGVYASLAWFVMHELMGNESARVYDGSMHEWSHLGRPVSSMKIE